jgi:hypothetical protein
MHDEQQRNLVRLHEIYLQKLGVGPFPTNECAAARITGSLRGGLVVYLSDIAGIASHGVKMATLEEPRKLEFQKLVARSFWERYPDAIRKISLEKTPVLFQRLEDTEEARLLIKAYFDDERLSDTIDTGFAPLDN